MPSIHLFSPYAPETCVARLQAAAASAPFGLRGAIFGSEPPKPAYGTVSRDAVVLREEPMRQSFTTNTPCVLRVSLEPMDNGTRLTGEVEAPAWLGSFNVVWILLATTIVITNMVPAVQALFPYGSTPIHWDWPNLLGPPLFMVGGLCVMRLIDSFHRAEQARLVTFLTSTLEATPVDERSRTT
jgi:hypothetical protein